MTRAASIQHLESFELVQGNTAIAIQAPASVPNSYAIILPNAPPVSTLAIFMNPAGQISFGSVNSDPTGTTSQTFHLDSDGNGPLLKNDGGVLQVRNGSDTGWANIEVGNVLIRGVATQVLPETVTIEDNILLLNSNVSGSPTENSGIEVERGTQTNASLIWDELNDRWVVGLAGSELQLARFVRVQFTNANVSAGLVALTHGLGQQYPNVNIYDNLGKIIIPDDITATSSTVSTIDLTTFVAAAGGSLPGTWTAAFTG